MKGLLSILSPFRNRLNKFNNTGARMLDCAYHMTLNDFVMKTSRFRHIGDVIMGVTS